MRSARRFGRLHSACWSDEAEEGEKRRIRASDAASVSRFPLTPIESRPEDLRAAIAEVEAKTGFVPNACLNLTNRPDEWRAFFACYSALMDGDESLTKAGRS